MNNDDMEITSKFNEGDSVWFFEPMKVKFMEGTIDAVNSWDKWSGFRYEIRHINPEGVQMSYNIEEKNIFTSKNDVLDGLFEENGTLAEQPVATPTPTPAPTAA